MIFRFLASLIVMIIENYNVSMQKPAKVKRQVFSVESKTTTAVHAKI